MHGVKRDRTQQSAELRAQRKEKEARKLQIYLDAESRFFDIREAGLLDEEALEATTALLALNPEFYTAWNYRRRVLESLFESSKDTEATRDDSKPDIFAQLRIDDQANSSGSTHDLTANEGGNAKRRLLQEDLELTMQALQMHPKVYWIWNHRKWCLQEMPSPDADGLDKWNAEIGMVNKMLSYDARNFHGWDYRRYILTQLAVPRTLNSPDAVEPFPRSLYSEAIPEPLKEHQVKLALGELKYTMSKIESNFSNFSAWHQRSHILPCVWHAQRLDDKTRRQRRDEEFELVRQAMFVDPEDESVWTYHDWLVSLDPTADVLEREIDSIRQLYELEPDSKWCTHALAHYLGMQNDEGAKQEARTLLGELSVKDPKRSGRYADTMASARS